MLILIAESKTMTACCGALSEAVYDAHRPLLEKKACEIINYLGSSDADELASALKISGVLARKLLEMIYEFPNKRLGSRAIEAFTGVVFRALDYGSLGEAEQLRCGEDIRIISSLYGWLRPDDVVKQYRLDFLSRLAPGGEALADFLRKDITRCLSDYIAHEGCKYVLNLLPADAMRCIDWKRFEGVKFITAVFSEMQPGGTFKTPNSNRLKTLRGRLLRKIILENIKDIDGLRGICDSSFEAGEYCRESGKIRFITVPD